MAGQQAIRSIHDEGPAINVVRLHPILDLCVSLSLRPYLADLVPMDCVFETVKTVGVQIIGQDPERAQRFAAVMGGFQQSDDGYALRHTVNGYDWGALPKGSTVVDLGGSQGELASAILAKHPHLEFVVQDLPKTIEQAPAVPKDVNMKLMVHDFFDPQPVKGAKVYMFRWILHNWSETYAIKVLQALIPALENGTRILIVDVVVPPQNTIPTTVDRNVRWMDLGMLYLFNAGDRPEEQWRAVFDKADSRFKFEGIKHIPGSKLSIIEHVWQA